MDKTEIRDILKKKIKEAKETILEYKEMVKPEAPDVAIGRVSRMDAINNRSVVESALRQAEERLKALVKVNESIDEKDFGKCRKCKQDIHIRRILIRPESLLCVNCAD